jgi:alpha-amylase
MRRRPEAYHATLRRHEASAAAAVENTAAEAAATTAAPASIHDAVRAKEAGLSAHLVYDDHELRSGLVRFLDPTTAPADWAAARGRELGDFVDRPFYVAAFEPGRLVVARDGQVATPDGPRAVRVEKVLTLAGDRTTPSMGLEIAVENRSDGSIEARLGIEWSITMLGGGGNPAAWYEVGGTRTAHDVGGQASGITRVEQGNEYVGLSLATTASPSADAWWAPIETVSNSEAGFERIYQGNGLLLSWPLRLEAGARTVVRVDQVVAATRDRAAEESAAATTGA